MTSANPPIHGGIGQKNGSIVHKMIGYDRFEGLVPCRILAELYQSSGST